MLVWVLLVILGFAMVGAGVALLRMGIESYKAGDYRLSVVLLPIGLVAVILPLAVAEDLYRHRHDPPKTQVECPVP